MLKVFCLMVSGIDLTEDMRMLLLRTARKMRQERQEICRVVSDDLEGLIKTDFLIGGLGDIWGIVFHAEVESVNGKAIVHYIVQTRDLETVDPEDMVWTDSKRFSLTPQQRKSQWN